MYSKQLIIENTQKQQINQKPSHEDGHRERGPTVASINRMQQSQILLIHN